MLKVQDSISDWLQKILDKKYTWDFPRRNIMLRMPTFSFLPELCLIVAKIHTVYEYQTEASIHNIPQRKKNLSTYNWLHLKNKYNKLIFSVLLTLKFRVSVKALNDPLLAVAGQAKRWLSCLKIIKKAQSRLVAVVCISSALFTFLRTCIFQTIKNPKSESNLRKIYKGYKKQNTGNSIPF